MTKANKPLTVFAGVCDLIAAEGATLGPTDWVVVEQNRIDDFAEATDDRQWIHVDPVMASDGPYGRTIAHGLLTLSLLPRFMHELYRVDNVTMAINYGFNKVRFITPVPRRRPPESFLSYRLGRRRRRRGASHPGDDDRGRGRCQTRRGCGVDHPLPGVEARGTNESSLVAAGAADGTRR